MINGSLVKAITKDGIELQGFWVNTGSDTAVFHSHGTGGDFYTHRFIELEGERLSAKNISFLTANNRGHDVFADLRKYRDGKVEFIKIGSALEKFEDCILDISAWVDFLQAQGIKKVILQGHSLSQKLIYYQFIKKDPRIIGQIHLSPCNDAGFMYHLLGQTRYIETNKMIKKMVESGRQEEMLPKELSVVCPMTALAYSGYLTEEGAGNIFPYHDKKSQKWETLSKIKEPLLAIFGGSDNFIKPSVKEAAGLFKNNAISSKIVNVTILEDAPHSYVGYENQLVAVIFNWIKKTIL